LKLWRGRSATVLAADRVPLEAAFSPNGRLLATISQEYDPESNRIRRLELWTVATGKLRHDHVDRGDGWEHLAWASNSGKLAMSTTSGDWQEITPDVREYRLESTVLTLALGAETPLAVAGTSTRLAALAISPDNRRLAVGRNDGRVELWTIGAKTARFVLEAPSGEVGVLAWSPDGNRLFAISQYGTGAQGRLWDTHSGKQLWQMGMNGGASSFRRALFSPDGLRIAAQSDYQVQIWRIKRRHLLFTAKKMKGDWWVAMTNFARDGKTLFLWSHKTGSYKFRLPLTRRNGISQSRGRTVDLVR
jgi:WD40 repeat protein